MLEFEIEDGKLKQIKLGFGVGKRLKLLDDKGAGATPQASKTVVDDQSSSAAPGNAWNRWLRQRSERRRWHREGGGDDRHGLQPVDGQRLRQRRPANPTGGAGPARRSQKSSPSSAATKSTEG